MKKNLLYAILGVAFTAGLSSCADNKELDLTEFTNGAFDRWMEKYHPNVDRLESGMYIEWIERNPNGKSLNEGYFMSLNYTGRDQNGDFYLTRNKDVAQQVGFHKDWTHYVPEYTGYTPSSAYSTSYYNNYGYGSGYGSGYGGSYSSSTYYSSSYPIGAWQALRMMNEGDSVRLYIPPTLAYDSSGFSNSDKNNGYSPYMQLSASLGLIFEMRLSEVVKDPFLREREMVEQYAVDSLGVTSLADSIAMGTYFKLLESNPEGEQVTETTMIDAWYTGRFLDGFIFDTNIDSIATKNGTYISPSNNNNIDKYVALEFNPSDDAIYVKGFIQAFRHMRNGERARVVMVSGMGYGLEGSTSGLTVIPPYTPLVFDLYVGAVEETDTDEEDE